MKKVDGLKIANLGGRFCGNLLPQLGTNNYNLSTFFILTFRTGFEVLIVVSMYPQNNC